MVQSQHRTSISRPGGVSKAQPHSSSCSQRRLSGSLDGGDGVMVSQELSAHPFVLFGNLMGAVSWGTLLRYIGLHLLVLRSRRKLGKDEALEVLQLLVSPRCRNGSH